MPNTTMLNWETGLSSAFIDAQIKKKNLIVMVEDKRCKWCVKMKEGALQNKEIQKIFKQYILVKVQRSNTAEVKQLNGFDGTIPNFFFITSEKEIVENVVGYFNADDFLGYIKEIQADGF